MGVTSQERPLITLTVIAYNHEPFILEALRAAVAQDYSPLEIVVSDDASSDKTFAIISSFAAAYTGPHRLVINRNPANLGIAGNWNVLCGLAKGELIVSADGDDVSLPNRVTRMHACYESAGRPLYMCARARCIDERGTIMGAVNARRKIKPCVGLAPNILGLMPGVFGAASAFQRSLIDTFGPLQQPSMRFVDRAFPFRALLLGGRIEHLDEVLVHYRQHGGGTCGLASTFRPNLAFHRRRYIACLPDYYDVLTSYHRDLVTAQAKGLVSEDAFLDAEFAIAQQCLCLGLSARAMAHATVAGRLLALLTLQGRTLIRIWKRIGSRRREFFLR